MEALIKCMPTGPDEGWDSFKKTWARETNSFYAQCSRDDTPIADRVLALLCESVEDVRAVLEIYRDWDIGLFVSMRKVARLRLEIAQLDGIALPGMAEKLALFSEESDGEPRQNESKPRPWWRVWS
jgi:hypothetical protein